MIEPVNNLSRLRQQFCGFVCVPQPGRMSGKRFVISLEQEPFDGSRRNLDWLQAGGGRALTFSGNLTL
jgi:hypothetical protein